METVDRTRDMPGYRIDGFLFAAEALGGTGIDQAVGGVLADALNIPGKDDHRPIRLRRENHRLPALDTAVDQPVLALPFLKTAIQHRSPRVTQEAQQPPQAAGKGAAGSIVNHHLGILADAPISQPAGHLRQSGSG